MLTLDSKTHIYSEDGIPVKVPNVTTILAEERYSPDFSRVPYYLLEAGRDLGNNVHDVIKLSIAETLHYESTDPLLLEYNNRFWEFIQSVRAEIVASELIVRSKRWNYIGTLDLVLRIDGNLGIYDIKTGVPTKSAALQTMAYKLAFEEQTGLKIKFRAALQLFPDEMAKLYPYKDKTDEEIWKAIVTTHNSRGRFL